MTYVADADRTSLTERESYDTIKPQDFTLHAQTNDQLNIKRRDL